MRCTISKSRSIFTSEMSTRSSYGTSAACSCNNSSFVISNHLVPVCRTQYHNLYGESRGGCILTHRVSCADGGFEYRMRGVQNFGLPGVEIERQPRFRMAG